MTTKKKIGSLIIVVLLFNFILLPFIQQRVGSPEYQATWVLKNAYPIEGENDCIYHLEGKNIHSHICQRDGKTGRIIKKVRSPKLQAYWDFIDMVEDKLFLADRNALYKLDSASLTVEWFADVKNIRMYRPQVRKNRDVLYWGEKFRRLPFGVNEEVVLIDDNTGAILHKSTKTGKRKNKVLPIKDLVGVVNKENWTSFYYFEEIPFLYNKLDSQLYYTNGYNVKEMDSTGITVMNHFANNELGLDYPNLKDELITLNYDGVTTKKTTINRCDRCTFKQQHKNWYIYIENDKEKGVENLVFVDRNNPGKTHKELGVHFNNVSFFSGNYCLFVENKNRSSRENWRYDLILMNLDTWERKWLKLPLNAKPSYWFWIDRWHLYAHYQELDGRWFCYAVPLDFDKR